MKIIIAGAGDVGFHLAELLESENQDITLIDLDQEVLEHAATHLDVMTVRGDAASIEVLERADIQRAKLFLAVTTSEKTNLLAAILAKQMGVKKTVARVSNPEYLRRVQKEGFQKLGIDNLFSPHLLAAQEIERLLQRCSFTDIFEFEEGKISVIGFTVDSASPLVGKSLRQMNSNTSGFLIRAIAILRAGRTIIPHGDMVLASGDHLYLVTKNEYIDKLTAYVGKSLKKVKKVMIVGGSPLALPVAKILEDKYAVTLVEQDRAACKKLIERLHHTLVIKGDPSNIDLLREEGLGEMDAFISLTPNSETNIITSLMAKEEGLFKTIALVDNAVYTHISQNIGVDTIINKKIIAANNIFRFVRKGKIEAITSLHGVNAEVIEFVVHKQNQLTKKSLRNLRLPKKSLIAGVVRGKEAFIPDGDFQMQLNDKVIVFAMPGAIGKMEGLFQ
ncbi:MAG TPA: Trk system potassium transporter TrkA [Bacteroidetes bacterium]|nr:Trk system potassium transporter TrkA [Bacteroidota bacterium]